MNQYIAPSLADHYLSHSERVILTKSLYYIPIMSFESDDFSGDECYAQYEFCSRRRSSADGLPFDPSSIESIILKISDKFNFRVLMMSSAKKAKGAALVTKGLALAGGVIGKAYGGKMGAAVGRAVGGVCGFGLVGEFSCFKAESFPFVYLESFSMLFIRMSLEWLRYINNNNTHSF